MEVTNFVGDDPEGPSKVASLKVYNSPIYTISVQSSRA